MSLATRTLGGSLTLEQLEHALGVEEPMLGTLSGLEPKVSDTIATYDLSRPAPAGRLVVLITGPAMTPPERAAPVLRGRAFVAGRLEPVAVFRLAADEGEAEEEDEYAAEAADWDALPADEEDFGFITGPPKR